MKNIVSAAQRYGVNRIVFVTVIGAGDSLGALSETAQKFFAPLIAAKTEAENYLLDSGLDATILRPGGLRSEPASGTAILTADQSVMGTINRADLADLIVKCLDDAGTFGEIYHAIDPKSLICRPCSAACAVAPRLIMIKGQTHVGRSVRAADKAGRVHWRRRKVTDKDRCMKKIMQFLALCCVLVVAAAVLYIWGYLPRYRPAPDLNITYTPELVAKATTWSTKCCFASIVIHRATGRSTAAPRSRRSGRAGPASTRTARPWASISDRADFPGLIVYPQYHDGRGNRNRRMVGRRDCARHSRRREPRWRFFVSDHAVFMYTEMSDDDVSAVIAYLRTISPVKSFRPERKLDFPLNVLTRLYPKPLAGPVPATAAARRAPRRRGLGKTGRRPPRTPVTEVRPGTVPRRGPTASPTAIRGASAAEATGGASPAGAPGRPSISCSRRARRWWCR